MPTYCIAAPNSFAIWSLRASANVPFFFAAMPRNLLLRPAEAQDEKECSRVSGETESERGLIDAQSGAVAPRGELRVTGWALGPDGPLDGLLVLVDGRIAESVCGRRPRPDVGAAHPDVPESAWAGWEATVDLRRAAGPVAEIALLVASGSGGWRELDRHRVRIDHSRSRGGRRSRAVFTIVQNEAGFLPLWLSYYGNHFDAEDVYVLDHDSTDGSTEGLDGRCCVIPVHRDKSFDHVWMKSTVEAFQAFLLKAYDTVLFAEVDEFVVADPHHHSRPRRVHRLAGGPGRPLQRVQRRSLSGGRRGAPALPTAAAFAAAVLASVAEVLQAPALEGAVRGGRSAFTTSRTCPTRPRIPTSI